MEIRERSRLDQRAIETHYPAHHDKDCNGTYDFQTIYWDGFTPVPTTIKRECNEIVVSYSCDYEIFHLKMGRCFFKSNNINENELIELALKEKHGREVYKYHHRNPPLWNGETFIHELAHMTSNGWGYWIETPIEKIPNIWHNEEVMHGIKNSRNYMVDFIISRNMDYLKRNEFVSHRANNYYATSSDINKLITKINNQTK